MSSGPSTNSAYSYIPPSEEQVKLKRRRTRKVIIAIFLALVGLTFLENYFLQQQTTTSVATNIAVLTVFNIILILLFVLIVLIIRQLVKLYYERKSNILGSRFQTKLIITFLILALVPSILLFTVASKLFTYSIGSWFNIQVEQTLQQSMDVAREYYSHRERQALSQTRIIERFITQRELYLQENRNRLYGLIQQKVKEYNLGGLVVFDNNKKVVASEFKKSLGNEEMIENGFRSVLDGGEFLEKNTDDEGISELLASREGNFLAVAVPLTEKVDGIISIWGYIASLTPIPPKTYLKIENIRNTFENYKQQSFLKLPVSASYYITFLMITLLILFSAIWLGFYMARGITIPIQQLAEGTRRIAEGNLDFQLGIQAKDEIGVLVQSFNTMTQELRESRVNIQQAHENLKLTNIELERRRKYIETILENIGAGVISVDKRGRITTFNKAAEKILNIMAQEAFGSTYKDVFDPSYQEPIRKMTRRMKEQRQELQEQQIEIRVEDSNVTLLVNIQVLRDAGKKYLGLVIVFEDLTQLVKTQRIAAWKEVAQGIAHEIKNPLTPIQLNTQRLRKKFYEDKKGFAQVFEESITIISQEVETMKDLLNEFLRFSRMPTPKPKMASLHKIIDDAYILYADHDQKITIKKNYDPNIHQLNIDEEQIRRVFINLFENALDALKGEGCIEISTRLMESKARIEFSDNGMGIAAEDRDKLFRPHFTTKKRGTGLGLAIVNRIIVDHDGSILVKDNYPKGTIFVIELPHTPISFNAPTPV